MDRDLKWTTVIVLFMLAIGLFIPKIFLTPAPGRFHMSASDDSGSDLRLSLQAPTQSLLDRFEISSPDVSLVQACAGTIERYQTSADGKTSTKSRKGSTIVFLSSLKKVHFKRATLIDSRTNESLSTRPQLIVLEDLRSANEAPLLHEYDELMSDAVELCIGSKLSPAQLSIEAANLKDFLQSKADFAILLPEEVDVGRSSIRLELRDEGTQTEAVLDINLDGHPS